MLKMSCSHQNDIFTSSKNEINSSTISLFVMQYSICKNVTISQDLSPLGLTGSDELTVSTSAAAVQ
jgi:hypothetical protein